MKLRRLSLNAASWSWGYRLCLGLESLICKRVSWALIVLSFEHVLRGGDLRRCPVRATVRPSAEDVDNLLHGLELFEATWLASHDMSNAMCPVHGGSAALRPR